ncbi:MAG: DUF1080 domain-containing protein [Planctomycetaceae bacterium]|nr:DUF1080 domain-containing protein [Planctomycetaceae bacterium]
MKSLVRSTLLILILGTSLHAADNELSKTEKEDGWQLLFNGHDLTGWKCNNGKPIATQVEDESLLPYQSGGYLIIHEKQFSDFILSCDVRFEDEDTNSGIFFRIENPEDPVNTSFEVQVMAGKNTGKHEMGAIYDLVSTTKNAGKPTGEWNHIVIRCEGPNILVTVNGEEVSQLNCDEFDEPGVCPDGAKHKFKLDGKPRAVKDFARCGYLGFQDHGHKVWYKNVKLLEL